MRASSTIVCGCMLLLSCLADLGAQDASLERSRPEAEGVSSAQLLEFVQTLDQRVTTMHSVMVLRHGKVVLEAWWAPQSAQEPHVLWSLSKSFTSTAVGLAIQEEKLSLDDPVVKFFPDELPDAVSDHLNAMTIRDLLTMSAGHESEVKLDRNGNWARAFLSHYVPHAPGTHFRYNTPATYMLSAIVQRVTGERVVDYLRPRLFEPLGIEAPRWDQSPQGESIGGYGLFLKTEDIAKFGQLYLQKGKWRGEQLIPESWVSEATSKQVENGSNPESDWNQGYGYQFWQCRHGAYRGDGMAGQFCVVIPEMDVVVVMTADCADMQGELNVVWEKLLPAVHREALPENDSDEQKLRQWITKLEVRRQ